MSLRKLLLHQQRFHLHLVRLFCKKAPILFLPLSNILGFPPPAPPIGVAMRIIGSALNPSFPLGCSALFPSFPLGFSFLFPFRLLLLLLV